MVSQGVLTACYNIDEIDTLSIAQEAVGAGLIKQDILDHLTSLHPQVPNSMKQRYFLMHLHRVTRNDEELFAVMVQLLVKFQPCTEATVQCTFEFTSEHAFEITEFLARYAYKWDLIGTALKFHPQDLKWIKAENALVGDSVALHCLKELIEQWIEGKYRHTKSATLGNLATALSSNTVGLGAVARELQSKNFIPNSPLVSPVLSSPYYIANVNFSFDGFTLIPLKYTSNTEYLVTEENGSVLLEIRVETDVSCDRIIYQWSKNSAREDYTDLVYDDAERYFGTKSSILCISNATIDMDGFQYVCEIATSEKHPNPFLTKAVTLRVGCPLDKYKDKLKSIYLSQPEVPEDTWPPVSNKTFINLALIRQDNMNCGVTDYPCQTVDEILLNKETIESEDVLKGLESGQQLLIVGRPGSGKTTFVHKITRDWASSYNGPIRLLLLLSLRKLNIYTHPGLADLLHRDLRVSMNTSEERNGLGVCFIFDGLDEFSPSDGKDSIVHKIIQKEYLNQSIVIIASRPVAIAKLRNRANKIIEVLGFRRGEILEYFDHYPFSTRSMSTQLKTDLTSHPNILHMCYLPIHAAMVAFLFQQTGKVPQTETEIYEHFTRFTLMHTLSKNEEIVLESGGDFHLNENQRKVFDQICKLALSKTIANKQVLHQDELELYFLSGNKHALSMGFINVDRIAGLYGFHDIYTFLHLTFQEYLAACYISTLSAEEQLKLIHEQGDRDSMQVVWKFYCGIVKFERSDNDCRFKALLERKSGQNHLYRFQCAYESQQDTACVQVLKSVHYHIMLSDSSLTTPDFTAIGFVIRKSVIPLKLSIVNCEINHKALDILWRHRENVTLIQYFHYRSDVIDIEKMDCIEKILKNLRLLKVLSVESSNSIAYTSPLLTVGIRYFPYLNSLSLSNVNLGRSFFQMDSKVYKNLEHFKLCECISNDSATLEELTNFLQCCVNLQTIDLSKNQIDNDGAYLLSSGLQSCSKLERVNLANNCLGFKGVTAVLTSLQHCSTTVETPKLLAYGNRVTYEELLVILEYNGSCYWQLLV